MTDLRAVRAAENENLFRRVNERVEELSLGRADRIALVCECASAACVERIADVPVDEYERVRSHAEQFFVLAGHERRDVEVVVEERSRYVIVAKQGEAAELAELGDPRSE